MTVNPAAVRTSFFQSYGLPADRVAQVYDDQAKKYPVGRVGEVSDVSGAVTYLADDKTGSFLTGVLLTLDGGSLLSMQQ